MKVKTETKEQPKNTRLEELSSLILKGVSLAMGISVTVLSFLNQIETCSAIQMLGIGLVCLSILLFQKKSGE